MFSVKTLRFLSVVATFILFIAGNFIEAIIFFGLTLLIPEED